VLYVYLNDIEDQNSAVLTVCIRLPFFRLVKANMLIEKNSTT